MNIPSIQLEVGKFSSFKGSFSIDQAKSEISTSKK